MKIVVLGTGYMGAWFSYEFSRRHEVGVYDINSQKTGHLRGVYSLKDLAESQGGRQGFFYKLVDSEVMFFFGLSCSLAAVNISVWGTYHEMNFMFCFINMWICLFYAGYRLELFRTTEFEDEEEYEEYEEEEDLPDA